MTPTSTIRAAVRSDLDALENIEQRCFNSDKLSRRSFTSLIKPGPHSSSVIVNMNRVCGYSIVLYRTGTSLARLYSIALEPSVQGQGLARKLLNHAESQARKQGCLFMRLEVRVDNPKAIALYKKLAYSVLDIIDNYYQDGCAAQRFEKRLQLEHGSETTKPLIYYRQTTDFSCGPSALMMALASIDNRYQTSRREELQIWREATTIFMTTGHGGCSPHGLALAAFKRGFSAQLYINRSDPPFIDSVRSEEKRQVIRLVHQDFCEQLQQYPSSSEINPLGPTQFKEILERHEHIIALISTWALNRNRAPHWVYVSKSDQDFVYISDPDTNDSRWQSETDFTHVPITIAAFINMACFGRNRLRCLLAIHPKDLE
ncbi:Ribosomal-protein-alanine acetyltransferase [Zhongshania aliphaticivorans]|uniref:Ribosomal-protein-alanine acetyltransferase n=1 Tax=Zhongshania aliphaticivorans TaxID=1470434 RepID=A0A5S9MN75_9GAMM|nr:GNAT family N-acetyltransferase/peptidase C39 family protein [Zhongshania aliphaticivorans]CAA0078250.1 Ribosomal-protein-alanine acetyltransferase [Zhongshania aliphaticivorans]CAA0086771.1 Ribosomal-protein-alanine acetyltransferase [Zhongshania aliphaticivorans]